MSHYLRAQQLSSQVSTGGVPQVGDYNDVIATGRKPVTRFTSIDPYSGLEGVCHRSLFGRDACGSSHSESAPGFEGLRPGGCRSPSGGAQSEFRRQRQRRTAVAASYQNPSDADLGYLSAGLVEHPDDCSDLHFCGWAFNGPDAPVLRPSTPYGCIHDVPPRSAG